MAIIFGTTLLAQDAQAALLVSAWQDKSTNSKALYLPARSSTPPSVPKDFISHFFWKPTQRLGALFGCLYVEWD